jgi:hypothetical protein
MLNFGPSVGWVFRGVGVKSVQATGKEEGFGLFPPLIILALLVLANTLLIFIYSQMHGLASSLHSWGTISTQV